MHIITNDGVKQDSSRIKATVLIPQSRHIVTALPGTLPTLPRFGHGTLTLRMRRAGLLRAGAPRPLRGPGRPPHTHLLNDQLSCCQVCELSQGTYVPPQASLRGTAAMPTTVPPHTLLSAFCLQKPVDALGYCSGERKGRTRVRPCTHSDAALPIGLSSMIACLYAPGNPS